jgi:hypothetical protein
MRFLILNLLGIGMSSFARQRSYHWFNVYRFFVVSAESVRNEGHFPIGA